MGKKSTKIVVQDRVKEISELYLQGMTRAQILQYATENEWGVKERQIDDYIKKATLILEDLNKTHVETIKGIILLNQWKLFNKTAIESSTYGIARQILMDIAKIGGIGTVNINHTLEDKRALRDFDEKELFELLEESED